MSTLSNYLRGKKIIGFKKFFGEHNCWEATKQTLGYKAVIDQDNIIIRTQDRVIEEGSNPEDLTYKLIVGNQDIVYLKPWQLRRVWMYVKENRRYVEYTLVKLTREYYKVYKAKDRFKDFSFNKVDTFDDLLELAKQQDIQQLTIKL